MNCTYTITVMNCECHPSAKLVYEDVPESRIRRAIDFARRAFRQVEIINQECGEIAFSHYIDSSFFEPVLCLGEAIEMLSDICYGIEE